MAKNESFVRRLGFALHGIADALRHEKSLRFQLLAMLCLVLLLAWLQASAQWWAAFSLASFGVLSAELFNTALERLLDHLHPALHSQVRIAKDCAAGAVLLATCAAGGVGIAFLVDRFC